MLSRRCDSMFFRGRTAMLSQWRESMAPGQGAASKLAG